MMSKKSPQLRFEGFTDDWEDRKLSDVANHRGGTAIEKYFDKDGVYKVISIGSYGLNSQYVDQNIRAISNEITDGRVVNSGELTMVLNDKTTNGTIIGRSLLVEKDNEYVINQRTEIISPKENFDSNFAYTILNGPFREKVKRIVQGGTQIYVNYPAVSNLNLELPKIEEQQKIGSFFKQLDDIIYLHQRKLDLLKEQKKGYLQKMFPKNGEKVPELRFAGFADDWEERKLGELSNIVGGGTPSTSNPEYWGGDIDWYAPAEIGEQSYVSKSKKTITELGLKKSSARILPVGTVLFTSRAGIGNTAILAKEATTNQGFQSIVPVQNKLDSYFIFSRTNELKRYGEVTGAGSTFVEVSGKQMSKMSIMVPELSEQQKIGSFFKQLDNTIALHQRKLELLKEQKKGFLQKMFV
ncbi:restriction endonuclease subunit S [Lactococcus lactis]